MQVALQLLQGGRQCVQRKLFSKYLNIMYTAYVRACLRLYWPAGHQYAIRRQRDQAASTIPLQPARV